MSEAFRKFWAEWHRDNPQPGGAAWQRNYHGFEPWQEYTRDPGFRHDHYTGENIRHVPEGWLEVGTPYGDGLLHSFIVGDGDGLPLPVRFGLANMSGHARRRAQASRWAWKGLHKEAETARDILPIPRALPGAAA
jgi:hypothetical protein